MLKIFQFIIPLMSILKRRTYNSLYLGLSILLWTGLGIPFYLLSASTNLTAAETYFSGYPELIQMFGDALAITIDPMIQALLIVAFLSFVVIQTIKQNSAVKEILGLHKKEKDTIETTTTFVMYSTVVIALALIIVTLSFSHYGGGKWAENHADIKYKPESKEARLAPFLKTKNNNETIAQKSYTSDLNDLKKKLKKNEALAAKKTFYAKNKMWGEGYYNAALKAEKWINKGTYEKEKKRIKNERDKAKNEASKQYDKHEASITTSYNEQKTIYMKEKSTLEEAASIGVNVWSIGSLILSVMIMLLTYKEYQKEAVNFIHRWISDIKDDEQENKELYPEIKEALEEVAETRDDTSAAQLAAPPLPISSADKKALEKANLQNQNLTASLQSSMSAVSALTEQLQKERERSVLAEQKTFSLPYSGRSGTETPQENKEQETKDYLYYSERMPEDVKILETHWTELGEGDMSLSNILSKFGKEGSDLLHYKSKSGLHKIGEEIKRFRLTNKESDFFD